MTDTRDEREWTVRVCKFHGQVQSCWCEAVTDRVEYVPAVSLSRLQEAERERDSAWKARDRQKARADAAEAVVSRVREWAEPKTRMAGAEARRPFVELLSLLDLDPVSGGQAADQEHPLVEQIEYGPDGLVMDRDQGPAEGGGDRG